MHEGVHNFDRELVGETLGQSLPADFQDLGDGLLSADPGDVLGEGTLEALQSSLRSTSELGDLPPQAELGIRPVLGKGEEHQDARGGFKGGAPTLQFGGGVFGLQRRTRRQPLGLAWVLCQPCPDDVEHPNCSVPLLTISELRVELKKAGRGIFSLECPGMKTGLKRVLS